MSMKHILMTAASVGTLAALAYAADPVGIFGTDDRTAVEDRVADPWNAVMRVEATFPDDSTTRGSGVLVTPSKVMTAAHLVHSAARGGAATRVVVSPAFDGDQVPDGSAEATGVRTFDQWIDGEDPDFDLAVVDFGERVGLQETGYGISRFGDPVGNSIRVAGYPSDLDGGEVIYQAQGIIESVDGHRAVLSESIDASAGQVGGPVLLTALDGNPTGILQGSENGRNVATLLTEHHWAWVSAWRDDFDAPPDLVLHGVTSTFDGTTGHGEPGIVTADIENAGPRPASVRLSLVFDADVGPDLFVDDARFDLDAFERRPENLSIVIPNAPGARSGRFRVEVETTVGSPEADLTANSGESLEISLPEAVRAVDKKGRARRKLRPGEQAAFQFVVPAGTQFLKTRGTFRGTRIRYASPSGEVFELGNSASRRRETFEPEPGVWRVVLENVGKRKHRVRFRVKLKQPRE